MGKSSAVNSVENQDSKQESSFIILSFDSYSKYVFSAEDAQKLLEILGRGKRMEERYGDKRPKVHASIGDIQMKFVTREFFKELQMLHLLDPEDS